MKVKFVIPFLGLLFLLGSRTYSQSTISNGRENWFPNKGNVGIGTRNPSADLEVIGNLKVTNSILSNSIGASNINVDSLKVSKDLFINRNLYVNGNFGLGVFVPQERLHIDGNIKLSGNINTNNITGNELHFARGSFKEGIAVQKPGIFNDNVGIGIVNPVEKLEINGNIKLSGNINANNITGNELHFTRGSFKEGIAVQKLGVFNDNVGIGIANPIEKLEVNGNIKISQDISSNSLNTVSLNASNIEIGNTLKVTNNLLLGGNLGIGVSIPVEKLDVAGNLMVRGNIKANVIEATEIKTSNNTPVTINTPLVINEGARISGAVGIGTNLAVPEEYKLAVGGLIITSGVDVKSVSKWPDYVFGEQYHIKPLNEVESYIKTNGHLPSIPSAQEVESNGYSLSKMDALLLEKIEELTIYMIKLNKENEELKRKIEEMQAK